jgi:hypothetical protein
MYGLNGILVPHEGRMKCDIVGMVFVENGNTSHEEMHSVIKCLDRKYPFIHPYVQEEVCRSWYGCKDSCTKSMLPHQ